MADVIFQASADANVNADVSFQTSADVDVDVKFSADDPHMRMRL